ncbi:hypothetical protein [Halalkalicoccus tibetensis]|uniref:DUF1102 domain-containing protein n=1 Tax=Halalkalicoccus tibetensis TaxID=175632 RepID=A0ABD5VB62_9EURY
MGSGVLFGTGAFASTDADRSVSIAIAGDASAYLGIEGHPDYTGTEVAGGVEVVTLEMGELDGADGEGVNQRATTTIDEILTFTNQSANDIDIEIDSDVDEISFDPSSFSGLSPGSSESTGITIDTTDEPEEDLTGDLTINATLAGDGGDGGGEDGD